mmetsp:Transcript_31288/g.85986  ORF Transcript_31288/g.85986 Transcript_31288/m.85986 type:complete len:225 (-) Transcript_31288:10-684(-)
MVDPMFPTVLPQGVVALDVLRVAGSLLEQRCCGDALALHPEILLGIAPLPVRPESIHQAPMLRVPRQVPSFVEELPRAFQHPWLRRVPVNVQQILRPLILMPWLEAPRPVNVRGVVLAVLPIHLKLRSVMLPNEAVGLRCEFFRERFGEDLGTIQIPLVGRGLVRRNEGLAHVHVRILPTVGVVHDAIRADCVQIGALFWQPKPALHEVKHTGHGRAICDGSRR